TPAPPSAVFSMVGTCVAVSPDGPAETRVANGRARMSACISSRSETRNGAGTYIGAAPSCHRSGFNDDPGRRAARGRAGKTIADLGGDRAKCGRMRAIRIGGDHRPAAV